MMGSEGLTPKELKNRAKALEAFKVAQGDDYDLAFEQQAAQLENERAAALLRDYHQSRLLEDSPELQEALLLVEQEPDSPAGRKAKTLLFAAGLHEPQGSTTEPLEIVAMPKTVSFTPKTDRYPVAEIEVFGHSRAAKDIMSKMAARVGEQSVVVSKKQNDSGSTSFFVNAYPNRAEAVALKNIGAEAYRICPEGNRTSAIIGKAPGVERHI